MGATAIYVKCDWSEKGIHCALDAFAAFQMQSLFPNSFEFCCLEMSLSNNAD